MEAVSRLLPFSMFSRRNVSTSPGISLNDLPREIILIVVRMESNVPKCEEMDEDALESMRLISPSWNEVVISQLDASNVFWPLGRVVLRSTKTTAYASDPLKPYSERITMGTDLPYECELSRIRHGLGKWLTTWARTAREGENVGISAISSNFSHELSDPIQISTRKLLAQNKELVQCHKERKSSSEQKYLAMAGAYACAATLVATLWNRKAGLAVALTTLSPLAYLSWTYKPYRGPNGDCARREAESTSDVSCFSRFFSKFSSIDTLFLDEIEDQAWMVAALKSVGNLPIKTLEFRYFGLLDFPQRVIVQLIQRHQISHVSMQLSHFSLSGFDDLIREIIRLNATLDVYEIGSLYEDGLFTETPQFWKEKTARFLLGGISVEISTIHLNKFFNSYLKDKFIKTHLSVMTVEQRRNGFKYRLSNQNGKLF